MLEMSNTAIIWNYNNLESGLNCTYTPNNSDNLYRTIQNYKCSKSQEAQAILLQSRRENFINIKVDILNVI